MMHEKALGLLGISQKGGNIELARSRLAQWPGQAKQGSSSLHPMLQGIRFAGSSPSQPSTVALWR